MTFSPETQNNIERFAREQAARHMDNAELSYFETLAKKGNQTLKKLEKKMSKLKLTSDQMREAQEDLASFMQDYMEDLVSQGHSEEEALRMAKAALQPDSGTDLAEELQARYAQYYEVMDPQFMEAVGVTYGAFCIMGVVLGAIAGLLLGYFAIREYFLIVVVVSVVCGAMLGTAFGMLKHASLLRQERMRRS